MEDCHFLITVGFDGLVCSFRFKHQKLKLLQKFTLFDNGNEGDQVLLSEVKKGSRKQQCATCLCLLEDYYVIATENGQVIFMNYF